MPRQTGYKVSNIFSTKVWLRTDLHLVDKSNAGDLTCHILLHALICSKNIL